MGLLNFDKQEIARAVIKKLRIKLRKGKERNGWYFLDGVPVLRVTIPHGSGQITPGTVNSIIHELMLSKEQFRDLIQCALSASEYEETIRSMGLP